MKSSSLIPLATLLALIPGAGQAANYILSEQTALIAPTGRGGANTTYFGWDSFTGNPPTAPNFTAPINDSTPDLGSATGASIVTNNTEDHISSSGNYYSSVGTTNETITAPTTGTSGSGFTTIIAQGIALFGGFGLGLNFSPVAGVVPSVSQGLNSAGNGQFVAVWEIPGNAASYNFTMSSPADNSHNSFDKIIVDTFWSPATYQGDRFQAVPEPTAAGLGLLSLLGLALRRRRA